jgi:hypothetical protein
MNMYGVRLQDHGTEQLLFVVKTLLPQYSERERERERFRRQELRINLPNHTIAIALYDVSPK